MGATAASCGAASCSGCGSIIVQADSKLARLAAARAAGDMSRLEVAFSSQGEDDPSLVAGFRLQRHMRDYTARDDSLNPEKAARRTQDELLQSCREGNSLKAVEAIKKGADIQVGTMRGQTPLMLAAGSTGKGTADTIRFLLDASAEMEAEDLEGWTPLLHACRNSEMDSVHLLLERGASIKARSKSGLTAAMLAAMDGGDRLVQELVNRQASLEKKDDRGWSLLFVAAYGGRVDMVKWLLRQQASARDKAKDGTTALMLAAEVGHKKIGERLLKRTANVNAANSEGNTPLIIALKSQRDEFAEWIIEEAADIAARNHAGEDAIDITEDLGMNAMRSKLEMKLRVIADD